MARVLGPPAVVPERGAVGPARHADGLAAEPVGQPAGRLVGPRRQPEPPGEPVELGVAQLDHVGDAERPLDRPAVHERRAEVDVAHRQRRGGHQGLDGRARPRVALGQAPEHDGGRAGGGGRGLGRRLQGVPGGRAGDVVAGHAVGVQRDADEPRRQRAVGLDEVADAAGRQPPARLTPEHVVADAAHHRDRPAEPGQVVRHVVRGPAQVEPLGHGVPQHLADAHDRAEGGARIEHGREGASGGPV